MLIAGFKPDSMVDWRGKIVATVFTHGCNFRCPFCHNFYLVTKKPTHIYGEREIIEEVKKLSPWIDGVCITGGEPTLHVDIVDFVKKLKDITRVKIDTNGTHPEIIEKIIEYVDYVAMDVKAPPYLYNKVAGSSVKLDAIKKSMEIIKKYAKDYEFRTTVIPMLSKEDLENIAKWIGTAKRYVLQQFSIAGGTLDPNYTLLKPYPSDFLKKVCESIKLQFEECLIVNI